MTFADWEVCVDAGGCRGIAEPSDFGWGRGSRPVINVNWHDGQDYAQWLSAVTGHDYRLLTEAEWEYAARGVTSTDDPRNGETWSFGYDETQLEAHAWIRSNSGSQTHPVGTKLANAFGLYDMHGNVLEWVQDCYRGHQPSLDAAASETDPSEQSEQSEDEANCSRRVQRGGSWMSGAMGNRTTARSWDASINRIEVVGLRVARTL